MQVAREVPIFGDPFGTGDLFFGIIDELRFDPEKYSLDLVELKTRKLKRMPGKAQKKQHLLQVGLSVTPEQEQHSLLIGLSVMPEKQQNSFQISVFVMLGKGHQFIAFRDISYV